MQPILEITWEWSAKFHPSELPALQPYHENNNPVTLQKPTKDETEDSPRQLDYGCRTFWMTAAEAEKFKKKFQVERVLPFCRTPANEIEFRQPELPPINTKCNVIVAGTTVTEVKQVTVKTDYCTDLLQTDLNEGWKILAICVQPDQRRPDYILGKT